MRKSIAVLLFAVFAALSQRSALAAPITVPTDLQPGDQYRLVFVTGADFRTNAFSNNIGDYNTIAANAAASVAELAALDTTWKAIGSTAAVTARDNTGTNPIAAGVPIYTLDDKIIAANNAALWSGNGLTNAISTDQTGAALGASQSVWTGTRANGTGAVGTGPPIQGEPTTLGNPLADVEVGTATFSTNALWIDSGTGLKSNSLAIYAMSGILTIPPPVPEPSSLVLASFGAVGLALVAIRRRRAR